MNGHLYGIGVGPGDPELLTIKAAGILGRGRVEDVMELVEIA